jgi:hypothetical protein
MPELKGPVRARDLRVAIKEYGAEGGIIYILERFLDEYSTHRQQLRELAEIQANLVDQFSTVIRAATELQSQVANFRRLIQQGDDTDEGAHG